MTWLPENVIKWAGGNAASLGEQSDERRVAGVFATVGQQAGMANRRSGGGEKGGGGPSGSPSRDRWHS